MEKKEESSAKEGKGGWGEAVVVQGTALRLTCVEELVALAREMPPIDQAAPVLAYYKTANGLLDRARKLLQNGDPELAFFHYHKYAVMLLELVPKHRQYQTHPRERASSRQVRSPPHCVTFCTSLCCFLYFLFAVTCIS